jgi:hypothetical protein
LLEDLQRGGGEGEDLICPAPHLGVQLRPRDDLVDEAPLARRLGIELAAQEPDLSRALLAHDSRQVAGPQPCVEGADARPGLPEAGRVRGDREIAQHVKHMTSADGIAVDGCDNRLGDIAQRPMQRLDLEQARLGRPVVTSLLPLLLVSARAERPIARSSQADDADVGTRPRMLQAANQLVDCPGTERVQPVGTVDGDRRQAGVDLIEHILKVAQHRPLLDLQLCHG